MSTKTFSMLAILAEALFCLPSRLPAQAQARLTGAVTDGSGAAVAGAQLMAKQIATSVIQVTRSSDTGFYSFPALPAGEYEIACEANGFKKHTTNQFVVETGATRTLDIQLELGSITESVVVSSTGPILDAESSTLGQFIERAMIVNMPLATRRSASLVRLMGAVVYSVEVAGHQVPRFSVAGGRSQNQMWVLDGGVAQNVALGNPSLEVNMPAEALQEFKAEVNNYSAEFGRTGGGLMIMTTRSGTNQFHGALYEFLRNDKMDARTFFAPSIAPLRYNIFGASLGGPIRRDRTFFFANYEGTRRRSGLTSADSIVPHVTERTGDFSARRDLILIDPLTRQPMAGNIIPASRIDPIARRVASFWPEPNVAGNDPSRAPSNNYVRNISDILSRNFFTTRVDHYASSKDRIYGRFIRVWGPLTTASIFPNEFVDSRASSDDNRNLDFAGSWIHNLSPAIMNEVRYTFGGRYFSSVGSGTGSNLNQELGIANVNPNTFARFNVAGLTSLGSNNHGTLQSPITTQEILNNVTWMRGKHFLKTGFSFRSSFNQDDNDSVAGGRYTFNDRATASGLASMLMGWTTTGALIDSDVFNTRTDYFGAYVQDDWKVTPRLTLNLGLRWEVDTPRWEKSNQQSGFDGSRINPVSGTPGIVTFSGLDGKGKYAHSTDTNNFGPRIGFAYRVRDGLVMRGGYGVSYYGAYGRSVVRALAQGFSLNGSFTSPDGGFTPAFLLSSGMPKIEREPLTPAFGAVPVGQSVRLSPDYFEPNHVNAYALQWNFSIQKQLSDNLLLEAAYLANGAHKLGGPHVSVNMTPLVNGRGPVQQSQRDRPYPQFNEVMSLARAWGNSSYHALNIKLEKRYSHGLNLLMNYTWSKFLDDVEGLNELAGEEGNGYTHIERRGLDKSFSGNHIPHRYVVSSVYDVPYGKGRRWAPPSRLLDSILGGWGVGVIGELRAGAPYGVIEQTNRTNTFSHGQRPNLLRDPAIRDSRSTTDMLSRYFDTAAFQTAGVGNFGNAARNVGLGPGYIGIDMTVHKNWHLTERYTLQLRGDFFNMPNRANFGSPATLFGRGDFGRIASLSPGATAREIQLSLRLEF